MLNTIIENNFLFIFGILFLEVKNVREAKVIMPKQCDQMLK